MIDPFEFRDVLSCYPTGVCAVTSTDGQEPCGMVIGSFTSISLNPPLVGFFPAKSSTSWPKISATGRFCVNVLSSSQLDGCKHFVSQGEDKFAGLAHRTSPAGLPLLDDAIAWLDCVISEVREIGDHFLVVATVEALGRTERGSPLVFADSSYHDITPIESQGVRHRAPVLRSDYH